MPASSPLAALLPAARLRWGRCLGAAWPARVRIAVVAGLYGLYFAAGGGLPGERMPYDAGHYWELAVSFQRQHHAFSLLYFDNPTRGYVAALLQLPALVVRLLGHCSMPAAAKTAGVGWAVLLYALALPALWRSLGLGRPAGGRWLVLVLLGFAFWRDHFSFTMVDMPALVLLLLALWAPSRPAVGWWWLAGLALAAACNSRPVYLAAALPALALAGWWSRQHGRRGRPARWAAWGLGAALVLGPQLAINRTHFQQNTPLVLARVSQTQAAPLYLKQLTWGTRVLRYDTGLQARLIYADPAGLRLLRQAGLAEYASYGQFLQLVARHPLNYGWRYLRHLFNGLDVQQPAPYLLQPYGPARPWVQLLNYTVLGVALATLASGRRWLSWPRGLVLLALLLPCAVAVPTAIECRFLLPLHLLLLAVAALRSTPLRTPMARWGQPGWALAVVLGAGLWLGGCFWLSAATFRNLQPDHGKSLVDD